MLGVTADCWRQVQLLDVRVHVPVPMYFMYTGSMYTAMYVPCSLGGRCVCTRVCSPMQCAIASRAYLMQRVHWPCQPHLPRAACLHCTYIFTTASLAPHSLFFILNFLSSFTSHNRYVIHVDFLP